MPIPNLKNPDDHFKKSWDFLRFQDKKPEIFPEISRSKRGVFVPYESVNYLLKNSLNRLEKHDFHQKDTICAIFQWSNKVWFINNDKRRNII